VVAIAVTQPLCPFKTPLSINVSAIFDSNLKNSKATRVAFSSGVRSYICIFTDVNDRSFQEIHIPSS
jgi:hypothetical protein